MRALPLGGLLVLGCSFAADYGGTAYLCDGEGACPSGHVCLSGRCVRPGEEADAAPPVDSWWDDDWQARRPLRVHNVSDGVLPAGYQIGWRVDLEAELGEDDHDALRVVRYQVGQDEWSEIPRVVDGAVIADEVVWFQLPEAVERDQEAEVWIYYDAASPPTAPWSGGEIFELADSFDDLTDRWVSEGPVEPEGDAVRFDVGAEMRSAEPVAVDRAVDFVVRISEAGSRLWFGLQRELPDLDADVPWLIWARREAGDTMLPEYAGPQDTFETRWSGTAVGVGTDPRIYSVERSLDRVVYRLDYQLAEQDHDHVLASDHSAPLYIRFSNTGSSSFWVSRARVRRVANPPPELQLGDEERLTP